MFDAYLGHHRRFLGAAALGLALYLLLPWTGLGAELHLVVAVDGFFLAYLAAILHKSLGASPETLSERARTQDEGIVLISILTVLAIVFSLVSILTLLNKAAGPDRLGLVLAILSVPLGWLMLHTMAAQHYADLFYAPKEGRAAGGLDFPGTERPGAFDFLYFSFVIGMTAQTADVSITGPGMRRAVLAHSIASFFFNTVLVAIGVNAALGGAG
ncbi:MULTISPECIES: DUF1345 domain-containing protein [unclassified Aureimonas]|uniref:DUF1345 domain-containing protein n=1 Tax=unclassified Aureimonas TaxID=2615206 RepID=UPI0006F328A4|nr:MULTISPECIES: DUF1345 domain-containing protein [unclassified Aureimonas]KQT52566.1 hypothetical protein ASG62_15285 [Aureimonas sp. Leaf427]KQT77533.1 hypothetical protein ASG54_11125 [Aureimonas sp. Leaf460]